MRKLLTFLGFRFDLSGLCYAWVSPLTLSSPLLWCLVLGRGVSGLIAILVLGIVMIGLISTAVTLTSRLQGIVNEGASRASKLLVDASQPPTLSLLASNGSLYLEILSGKPVDVEGVMVERSGSIEYKRVNSILQTPSRLEIIRGYSCEPVRVYLVLSSGLVVAYDPRSDPRVGFTPAGWDGWWRCGLVEGGWSNSQVDPLVNAKALGVSGGGNQSVTLGVGWRREFRSLTILVGASRDQQRYTWDYCYVGFEGVVESVLGTFTLNGSRVDVILGCTQGWPKAVYLTLRGPSATVYAGRVEFNYSVRYATLASYDEDDFYWRLAGYKGQPNPWAFSLAGPIPVSYTPVGSSSYKATRVFDSGQAFTGYWRAYFSYTGWGVMDFRSSTTLVLLLWATLKPDWYSVYTASNPYVELRIERLMVRVDNATRIQVEPSTWDLGSPAALKLRLYTFNLTAPPIEVTEFKEPPTSGVVLYRRVAPEPWSEAILKVYRLLPQSPRVDVVIETATGVSRRTLEPRVELLIAFPGARVRLEAYPHIYTPLLNGIKASYKDSGPSYEPERVRVYEGSSTLAPNPSPWVGPAVLEVERLNGEVASRTLLVLTWPRGLEVVQANTVFTGYAQIVADQPYTVKPEGAKLRFTPATIHRDKLVAEVHVTLDATRNWNPLEHTGKHTIAVSTSKGEQVLVWVN